MNTKNILLFLLLAAFITSCSDYLDPYPNGDQSRDDIWEYQNMVQGLIGQAYEGLPWNYNNNEGAYLDGATDIAVITSASNQMTRLALNSLTVGNDPFLTYWDRDYKSILLVNMFLKDRKGFKSRFIVNVKGDSLVRYRLQGEAFALRAYFYWDLLQKFGGKGMNGQMLGVPLVLEPLDFNAKIDMARNTYNECVQQIVADCDSAQKYLPIAHRDRYFTATELSYAGGRYWGRLDGITMNAIKASVYLTWASPRFNPDNDIARWDSAAVNAKKVMNFKLTQDNVANGFNVTDGVNWFNPQFPAIVWTSRANQNEDMERTFYPGGFQGNGSIGASQELVDAFPMKNGYPITDVRSNYNPANPYLDRDPRFYSVIFYNNSKANRDNNVANLMYTFENWEGGKDAAGAISQNSLTNYHIKKFVSMGWNKGDANVKRALHTKQYFRWAHMCLAFAEAANHVVGPNDAVRYGLSAKAAMVYLRARKTYDGTNGIGATDPYLTEVADAGEATFDAFVKNERKIETCFEGNWFFDIRRWTTTLDELNKPVHGAAIVKDPISGAFTYDFTKKVQDRIFTSAYLPIPYAEMLRMGNLVQNEGWDAWK